MRIDGCIIFKGENYFEDELKSFIQTYIEENKNNFQDVELEYKGEIYDLIEKEVEVGEGITRKIFQVKKVEE